jgi:hypothetical protein
MAVTIAAGVPWLSARDAPLELLDAGDYLSLTAQGIAAAALSGAIGVGIGAIVRNQVAAVVGALVYLFVLELGHVPQLRAGGNGRQRQRHRPAERRPDTTIEDKTFSCDVRAGRRRGESTCRLAHVDQMTREGDHETELPHKAVHTLSSVYKLPVPADREAREPPEGWEAARELVHDLGRRG